MHQSLSFALYRTYAVPSIGRLLCQTGELTRRPQRRCDDTVMMLDSILAVELYLLCALMIIWHAERCHDKNAEFYRDLLVELKKTFPNLRSLMFPTDRRVIILSSNCAKRESLGDFSGACGYRVAMKQASRSGQGGPAQVKITTGTEDDLPAIVGVLDYTAENSIARFETRPASVAKRRASGAGVRRRRLRDRERPGRAGL